MYGLRLQESVNSTSAGSCRSPESPPALQSPTKTRRTSSASRAMPNIFQGLHLVFWEQHHMRRAIDL